MTYKVAFIGLSVMGFPMAGFISKAGHDVTVYNEHQQKLINGLRPSKVILRQLQQTQPKMLILFLHVSAMIMI